MAVCCAVIEVMWLLCSDWSDVLAQWLKWCDCAVIEVMWLCSVWSDVVAQWLKWCGVCVLHSPEAIKHRNDMFYLVPEPSCVPDSPVWYSAVSLTADAVTRTLNRINVVREIQEAQVNQTPAYYGWEGEPWGPPRVLRVCEPYAWEGPCTLWLIRKPGAYDLEGHNPVVDRGPHALGLMGPSPWVMVDWLTVLNFEDHGSGLNYVDEHLNCGVWQTNLFISHWSVCVDTMKFCSHVREAFSRLFSIVVWQWQGCSHTGTGCLTDSSLWKTRE